MAVANDPELRAGDSDREQTAELLRRAHAEGRLDLDELDARLEDAYRARTLGELAALTRDLPTTPSAVPAPVGGPLPSTGAGAVVRPDLRRSWAVWATVVLVCTVVWGASAVTSGSTQGYWPIWVAGPWGAVLLARTLFR